MVSIRDIRTKGRGDVHSHASSPAIYLSASDAEAQVVSVRVHTKFADGESGPGAVQGLASMMDTVPKIRFLRSEVSKPRSRTGLVLLSADEGYRIHSVRPPHGITVDGEVSDLSAEELAEYWDTSYEALLA